MRTAFEQELLDAVHQDVGQPTDTPATTDTGTFSLIALFKRLLQKWTAGLTVFQGTSPWVVSGSVTTLESTGLVPKVYDSITYTNTSATVDTYKYYTGGVAGSLIATLTVTWTDSTKSVLTSVVRT